MLVRGCPTVVQNRDEYNDNGEEEESELASECGSMVLPLASCSGSIRTADVHTVKEKTPTSENINLSDQQHRTRAESMIGSSSSSIILHTELDVEGEVSFIERESKLLEEQIVAPGRHQSTTASRDLAEFHAELADLNIKHHNYDELPRVSELVGKSSSSRLRERQPEGDEAEFDLPDQDCVRNTSLNKSPIFGFWRRAQDRQDGENLESKLSKGQGKYEIPVAVSTVGHSRVRQLRREREEVRVNPIDTKGRAQDRQDGENLESKLSKGQNKHESPVAVSSSVVHSRVRQLRRGDEVSLNPIYTKGISLPDEMVEKILAMISFPEILKTRMLNKSWNENFSRTPGASVFHDQVRAVSGKWKHYCPIILNIEKECMVGYDREYNRWQNVPLTFEREGLRNWFSTHNLRGAGSLMCGLFKSDFVFVANIVTRTWKWLPSRPDMAIPRLIHVLPIGSEAYQVLLMTKDASEPSKVFCQLYDSRMEFWTITLSTVSMHLACSSSVYLNGVLYVMEYNADDFHDVMKLVSYDVSGGTWTNIRHPFGSMLHEIETFELLVCQNHVMVILHVQPTWGNRSHHNTLRNTLIVYKVDPDSLDIREVARGPPEPMSAMCSLFASDKACIYFGNPQVASSSVVELNVQNRGWSCLPAPTCADGSDGSYHNKWATFSFQPGMNPFVSV